MLSLVDGRYEVTVCCFILSNVDNALTTNSGLNSRFFFLWPRDSNVHISNIKFFLVWCMNSIEIKGLFGACGIFPRPFICITFGHPNRLFKRWIPTSTFKWTFVVSQYLWFKHCYNFLLDIVIYGGMFTNVQFNSRNVLIVGKTFTLVQSDGKCFLNVL